MSGLGQGERGGDRAKRGQASLFRQGRKQMHLLPREIGRQAEDERRGIGANGIEAFQDQSDCLAGVEAMPACRPMAALAQCRQEIKTCQMR